VHSDSNTNLNKKKISETKSFVPAVFSHSLSLCLTPNPLPDLLDHKGLEEVWGSAGNQSRELVQQQFQVTVDGVFRDHGKVLQQWGKIMNLCLFLLLNVNNPMLF